MKQIFSILYLKRCPPTKGGFLSIQPSYTKPILSHSGKAELIGAVCTGKSPRDGSISSARWIDWDIRSRLRLATGDDDEGSATTGIIDILRKADRSFERVKNQEFRAVNKDGYIVDLVNPEPKPIIKKERQRMGGGTDLKAVEIRNLQWLVSSPKFSQIVVGDDGYPAAMFCPDPRSFALHKIWLSKQPDRDPIKKKRDRHQGITVAYLVSRYLPQYKFTASELRMFPKRVLDAARAEISNFERPAGFN